jgi:alcohol dehydrogenase
MCQRLVAVGGRIANVGVHGTKVDLHLETLWDRNISKWGRQMGSTERDDKADCLGIHMSLVNATTTPRLLRLVESGKLNIGSLVTHRRPKSRPSPINRCADS